jgi:DNA-directed RNA polymerase subunit RPC12/RpoP
MLEHSQRSCKSRIFVKMDGTVAKKHKKTLPADPLL